MKLTMKQEKIAVLIACYNRRQKTVECLQHLAVAAKRANTLYQLFLFDDGSSDGTSDAVRLLEKNAVIIRGDGNYFWNRSMHSIFSKAMSADFENYLWLNDDTMLRPEAINLLMSAKDSPGNTPAMVVGAISDPNEGNTTYGGLRDVSPRIRPFLATLLTPNGQLQDVDVMNGNVVLIPNVIAKELKNLDPIFEHGMGDTDYSKRARKLGFRILLTTEFVGTCSRNALAGTHHDATLSLRQRLQQIFSRKGLPWRSWLTMCWRHGGAMWPLHFLWGYLKVIIGKRA